MPELIDVPVTYKGMDLMVQVELVNRGYNYGFEIEINNIPVLFELDEEKNYRVIVDETKYDTRKLDKELIKVILERLESLK